MLVLEAAQHPQTTEMIQHILISVNMQTGVAGSWEPGHGLGRNTRSAAPRLGLLLAESRSA